MINVKKYTYDKIKYTKMNYSEINAWYLLDMIRNYASDSNVKLSEEQEFELLNKICEKVNIYQLDNSIINILEKETIFNN